MNGLELINFLDAAGLQQMLQGSKYVLSRSGYTSLMEYLSLSKKMILVPTPGQTEQEYLADHMMQMGFAVSMKQHEFSLNSALEKANNFNYQKPEFEANLYHNAVDALLRSASAFDHSRG
jgi:UDP-N-acetylglucosamine transferase subunit ALG13